MGDYLKGNTWSEVYKKVLGVGAADDAAGLTAEEKDVWTDDGEGSKALAAFQLSTDTLLMRDTKNLAFGDVGTYINQSGDGVLNVSSDGSIVLDAETAINLDSDTGVLDFKDGGTSLLQITGSDSNVVIQPQAENKDVIFKEDGGTEVWRLDSSAESLLVASGKEIRFADSGENISGNGTDLTVASGGDINLTATSDVNIPSSVGLTFGSDNQKIEGDGTDLNMSATGSIILTSSEATADAIKLNASNAAGGLDIDVGTGGIDIISANQIDIDTSGAGQDINVDAQAGSVLIDAGESTANALKLVATGSHANTTVNIRSYGTGVSAIDIDSTGGVDVDADGDITIDTTDTSDGIKIGTVTSGVPITIGHTTSEVTVADNLTVTGTLTSGSYTPTNITTSGDIIIQHVDDPDLYIHNLNHTDGQGLRKADVIFRGEDSDGNTWEQATIRASHDGSAKDGKGTLTFLTNDGGDLADTLTERLTINSSGTAEFQGDVVLQATDKLYLDGGGNTYLQESSSDTLDFVLSGAINLRTSDHVGLHVGYTGQANGTALKAIGFGDSAGDVSADGASAAYLYAKDVTGTVELFGIDEAGNSSQLTPHNFSLFDKPDPKAWSYYCRNAKEGYELNVDFWSAFKALEELTGKKLLYVKEFEPQV